MLRFTIFRIPVQVQPWFWLTMGLIGLLITNPKNGAGLVYLALFMLAGFISVLVHELGHALTGKAFGAPTRIEMFAFGGAALFPANLFSRKQSFLVTAAGPAIQIVLGFLALGLSAIVEIPNPAGEFFLKFLGIISIFWALLNLIPVIPLDGGQLMATVLGPGRRESALKVSMVAAIVAGLAGLAMAKMIIFPVFLGMMAHQNWKELQRLKGRP